ncbi:hypothetical protein C0J45_23506, partial [Silurus meridionalis]
DLEARVKLATIDQPAPEGCPTDRLFVPEQLQSQVLQWCHGSPLFCHPGFPRTLSVLQQRFWWPTVRKDVREFVATCPTCTQHKNPKGRSVGLLRPLPVP